MQARLGCDAVAEGNGVRFLDGGPIGDGVGERHTQLDQIGAACLHGEQDLGGFSGGGITGGDVCDEGRLDVAFSTCIMDYIARLEEHTLFSALQRAKADLMASMVGQLSGRNVERKAEPN